VAELQSSVGGSSNGMLWVWRLPGPLSTQTLEELLGVPWHSPGMEQADVTLNCS